MSLEDNIEDIVNERPGWFRRKALLMTLVFAFGVVYVLGGCKRRDRDDYVPPVCAEDPIAFLSDRHGGADWEIYIMDVDGSNVRRVTTDLNPKGYPTWDTNRTILALPVYIGGNWEIYTTNTDGTNLTNITNNPANDDLPAWSPNGNKIAFQTDSYGNLEICTMNTDGSNVINITNNPSADMFPTYTHDGALIAFQSNRSGPWKIWTANPDGSNPIERADAYVGKKFCFSQDGTQIAYCTDQEEIWVSDIDGSNPVKLTDSAVALARCPSWSPVSEGNMITYHATSGGITDIFKMNPDGSNVTNLTNSPPGQRNAWPSWSR